MNAGAWAGLFVMVASEGATLARIEPFYHWNTPIAWTGFIVFADSLVWGIRKQSWIHANPVEFTFLALVSIPLWLVFEFYNLYIDNWNYSGLPPNFWLRQFGYAWSFATISPAIFEAADLIDVWRAAPAPADRSDARARSAAPAAISILVGSAMLVWPLVWPSPYLAAPVWLGFILLLDPVNDRLGEESLIGDANRGDYRRLINLTLSGGLCGVLWEFWNYWAGAKWHYTVPIMEHTKIFEMPLPGYLGFPAFAVECFTMYVFVRAVATRMFPVLVAHFWYPVGLGGDRQAVAHKRQRVAKSGVRS
jgi:hypothetical protein